jgi:hypothetical protein
MKKVFGWIIFTGGLFWLGGCLVTTVPSMGHMIAQTQLKPTSSTCPNDGRVTVVNLPSNQRFLYVLPEREANEISGRNVKTYVATNRLSSEPPRCIFFNVPGRTIGSWESILYIQEH